MSLNFLYYVIVSHHKPIKVSSGLLLHNKVHRQDNTSWCENSGSSLQASSYPPAENYCKLNSNSLHVEHRFVDTEKQQKINEPNRAERQPALPWGPAADCLFIPPYMCFASPHSVRHVLPDSSSPLRHQTHTSDVYFFPLHHRPPSLSVSHSYFLICHFCHFCFLSLSLLSYSFLQKSRFPYNPNRTSPNSTDPTTNLHGTKS